MINSNPRANGQMKLTWVNKLFQKYEEDVNIINNIKENKLQFLEIIALLIMDLERIHPYLDFNCRTFAVFLLNKELIRHDLTPSVMNDPNDFDFMTLQEVIVNIQQG